MIGILVDADLILEVLMNRNQLLEDISGLFDQKQPLKMYVTDFGWQKICAYASRFQNSQIAQVVIDWLKEKINVCAVDKNVLQQARLSPIQDFESAVEYTCAMYQEFYAIVTHRFQDFKTAPNKFVIWSVSDLQTRTSLEAQFQAAVFSKAENYSC
ncbi:MAG: hypothetical protein IGS39_20310 [Calothrix sp. C42_A2020_038]|nr:hypothetical protein [Calothrix sp. C42_A2020_038]